MTSRFDRQTLIADWEQNRLARATVVLAGVGALGNEVARILAQAGVGRLILCDPDVVAESNLSRTPLFRRTDVGRFKVEAARDALAELGPTTEIDTRSEPLVSGVGLAELREASLVIGCLDSRAARLQLAGRCGLVRAPSLDGGTHAWGGEVRLSLDPAGPCYGCGLTEQERAVADDPWSCQDVAATNPQAAAAPSSALVGGWLASFAVRWLMGLSCPAGIVTIDLARGESRVVQLNRDPDCPLHRPIEGDVLAVPVSHLDTVGQFLAALPPGSRPLSWTQIQTRADCRSCGYSDSTVRRACRMACPKCRLPLVVRTTLELSLAPRETSLAEFAVASRELLAFRNSGRIHWCELAAPRERPCGSL